MQKSIFLEKKIYITRFVKKKNQIKKKLFIEFKNKKEKMEYETCTFPQEYDTIIGGGL